MADIESEAPTDQEQLDETTCEQFILRASWCLQQYAGVPRPQMSVIYEHLMGALQQYRQMEAEYPEDEPPPEPPPEGP